MKNPRDDQYLLINLMVIDKISFLLCHAEKVIGVYAQN